jgi:hypothetical protein
MGPRAVGDSECCHFDYSPKMVAEQTAAARIAGSLTKRTIKRFVLRNHPAERGIVPFHP